MRSDAWLAGALVGVWRLTSYKILNAAGDVIDVPFGAQPAGMLVYTWSGYMSVSAMDPGRPTSDVARPSATSPQAKVAAFDTYFGYCGRYSVASGIVLHHVDVSAFPDWSGQVLRRRITLSGDLLELASTDDQPPGDIRIPVVNWRRQA
jgi:hypothetical protein